MDLIKINIIPSDYKLNFGLNSEVSCTVRVIVTDFNGNGISNYPISIACPDDTSQQIQIANTNESGWCGFEYTFNDANGVTGYRRFIVNDVVSNSIFLYRDTGWVTALKYQSGYSAISSTPEVRMRVVDRTVELRGMLQNNAAVTTAQGGTGIHIATMRYPKFGPHNSVRALLPRGLDKYYLDLNPNGVLWFARHGTNTTNKQLGANSWIRCYFTYTI